MNADTIRTAPVGHDPAADRPPRPSLGDGFLRVHGWLLLGYALLGRWFAYLGIGSLYVGEIVLALGLATVALSYSAVKVLRAPAAWLLAVFMVWGGIRTMPYIQAYGVDALRDAAIWGYGLFALIIGGLVTARPERLVTLLQRYRRFVVIFLCLAPVVYFVAWYGTDALGALGLDPRRRVKASDVMVHLVGVGAFMAVGLGKRSLARLLVIALMVLMAGTASRGSLLAFAGALGAVAVLTPASRRFWTAAVALGAVLVVLAITDFRLGGLRREASVRQLGTNLASVVGGEEGELEGTRAWRLLWWRDIVGYTVSGDYRWTGKGYGVNLADEDGFQVADGTLRSPHNGHLTILARSGVPGLLLWLLAQAAWVAMVYRAFKDSRNAGARTWSAIFVFLLAYWVAFMVTGAFDVFLEGPMGGIWFWSVYGAGLGAARAYHDAPHILS